MPLSIRHLDFLRSLTIPGFTGFGTRLYEALSDIRNAHNLIEQQTNSNSTGQRPHPPSRINSLTVTGQNGHFNVKIVDSNQNLFSGIRYYVEHDDNAGFTNPQVIELGSTRNHSIFLGNVTRYWRAYSSYATSGSSAP